MKYVSLDLETTGIDPEKHQILELGAILEDTNNLLSFEDIPKFNCIIEREEIVGHPIALRMNKRIIDILADYANAKGEDRALMAIKHNIIKEKHLVWSFFSWLDPFCQDSIINVAGKNYSSFDAKFLDKVQGWKEAKTFERRILDPSSLFLDWKKDLRLPSLDECLSRAGIQKTVSHNATEDAWDVVQVLRKKYDLLF